MGGMGVACCCENVAHVLLNATDDVVHDVPLKWVELMWVCPDESAEGQGNLIHYYGVTRQHSLYRWSTKVK